MFMHVNIVRFPVGVVQCADVHTAGLDAQFYFVSPKCDFFLVIHLLIKCDVSDFCVNGLRP